MQNTQNKLNEEKYQNELRDWKMKIFIVSGLMVCCLLGIVAIWI